MLLLKIFAAILIIYISKAKIFFMIQLSQSELQELATQSNPPCISIYMPTEKAGAETRKNAIRFKNLITEAAENLESSPATIKDSLEVAKSYIDNYDFWQHQDSGLAFFVDPEGVKYFRLPSSFEELVIVGDRFYLKPLLPLIDHNSKFYLLALSQNQVKFFFGNRYQINQLDLPESVPASLAEALKYDDPEKQLQYHSGDSGGSPVYHGQGVGTTDNKNQIERFFQKIDNGLQTVLATETAPLILASVEYLMSIYQEANSYANLLETGVVGNPENVSDEALHQQAWRIIEPRLEAAKQEAINQYQQLLGTGEATHQLEAIIPGAVNGQIDTLFIAADTQKWGKFDPQTNQVTVDPEATEHSIDLLDLAATKTYLQGGKIYLMQPEAMPEAATMMAILRYPVYAKADQVS
jgi:hypothetical protein